MFKRILKYLFILVASPIVLFLVLATLLYIPAVQNYAVQRASELLSEETGVDFSIERVQLSFPLNLAIHKALAVEEGDTLLDAQGLLVEVRLQPLFKGRADIDGLRLYNAYIDSKSYIPDVHIKGSVKELAASSHGIEWSKELVHIDRALLDEADFSIVLSDTAAPDTSTSTLNWEIIVERADIRNSGITLRMPGDSMHIGADIGEAELRDGDFHLGRPFYGVRSLNIKDVAVNYDLPLEKEAEGLDPNHLALSSIYATLKDVSFDENSALRARISDVSFEEKCGFALNKFSAGIYFDSTRVEASNLCIYTDHSAIEAQIAADWAQLIKGEDGECNVKLNAGIGHEDVLTLAQGFADRSLLNIYPRKTAALTAQLSGTLKLLSCEELSVKLPGILSFAAEGEGINILEDRRKVKARFNLQTQNLSILRNFLPDSLNKSIVLPEKVIARGQAAVNGNDMAADAKIKVNDGELNAKLKGNIKKESYEFSAEATAFPLSTILPESGLSDFHGRMEAAGLGFDPFDKRTTLNAKAHISRFAYAGWDLDSIRLDAELKEQSVVANIASHNTLLEATGQLTATFLERINANLRVDVPMLNLRQLTGRGDSISMGMGISIDAYAERDFSAFGTDGIFENIYFFGPKRSFTSRDITYSFATAPDTTNANINAGDLQLKLTSGADISLLGTQLSTLADGLMKNIEDKQLDQDSLKTLLPVMTFYVKAGKDNAFSNILRHFGYTFENLSAQLDTDPERGLTGNAEASTFKTGSIQLDAVNLIVLQDSTGVKLKGDIKNYAKRNPNKFEATLNAYLLSSAAGFLLEFTDSRKRTGMHIGLHADLNEEGIRIKMLPDRPVIAFRNFTVNPDNYILLRKDSVLFANVDLLADDGTGMKFYSLPSDSINDITLSLNRLNLGELCHFLPYMPNLRGFLGGDIHLIRDTKLGDITAMAMLNTEGLVFEEVELGNIGADVTYVPKAGGEHHASAFITVDYNDVFECNGTYFDRNGGLFKGDAYLHDFPLKLVNGFLKGTDVALDGTVGGNLSIKGMLENPEINGAVRFHDTHIFSEVYGFKFKMDEDEVLLKDNQLKFNKFDLTSTGKQPFTIDGIVDLKENLNIDLKLIARDFELINTKKSPKSIVYGKVFTDFFGSIRGTADDISVRGKLNVLNRTNVTYILKDSPLSADNSLKELVQFVDFSDTIDHKVQAETTTGIDLMLTISVSDAARFHCNLSEDGKNYVDLEGGGDLTMRLTQQGEMRLTGRFTCNSGEMKYALPIIPLKTFQLTPGSYIEFMGDMLNPTLNIAAKERVKATVNENDVPRSVTFNVGIAITQPLKRMGLEFTIDAPEDLSIQNQLASMTAAQRSKTAVAMLATGMYITDNSMSKGGFKANNALNAFLQSEIQNIAGSALKTVDISLGVESGTSSAGTTTTDYSFQFSKRFWGDRISVIIGGKVSTGADADYSAESFINNIAVEYRLDKSASRYVRVFYDRTQQDAFEGQITEGGVGLVLRRKSDRLGELFIFRSKDRRQQQDKKNAKPKE